MGEADLVVRFATSEPGSVDEMYREYGRLVYAVTKRVLGDAALAEEATRQTFVRAWRLAAGLDPSEPPGHPIEEPVGFALPSGRPYPVAHGHRLIFRCRHNGRSSSGGRLTPGTATPQDHELRLQY